MSSWQKITTLSLVLAGVVFLPSVSAQSTLSEQLEAITQQVNSLQQQILQTNDSIANTSQKIPIISANLSYGDSGSEVRELQRLLNQVLETPVSVTGPGSIGQESTYFGAKTLAAVKRFQDKYALDILAPSNLTQPTGFVGERTRAKLNELTGSNPVASIGNNSNDSQTNLPDDADLDELRSQIVFDKWELTEEDKRKIVQSVPAELRSQYFPEYAGDNQNVDQTAPQNILEERYQQLLEQQSSAIEMIKTFALIEAIKQPAALLETSLATIFGSAETAEAQGLSSVFGGRISLTVPCTCNPPAVLVTVVGVRPATVVYFPLVSQKSPPGPPTIGANTIGNYSSFGSFGACLLGAPPSCAPATALGTIILMGTSH